MMPVTKSGEQHPVRGSDKSTWEKLIEAGPILLAVVGGLYTCFQNRAHDQDAGIQMLRQREDSELHARGAIFKDLTNSALNDELKVESRLLSLETLMYNFHSVFNGRNLMQAVSDKIDYCGTSNEPPCAALANPKVRSDLKTRLRNIAQAVSRTQKTMIKSTMEKGGDVRCPDGAPEVTLHERESAICTAHHGWHSHALFLCRTTKRSDDPPDSIRIGMTVIDDGAPPPSKEEVAGFCTTPESFEAACLKRSKGSAAHDFCGSFVLSAYGTPFSDNTGLADGHRVALLLNGAPTKEITSSEHRIELVEFPDDFLPPGYQPTLTVVDRMKNGK